MHLRMPDFQYFKWASTDASAAKCSCQVLALLDTDSVIYLQLKLKSEDKYWFNFLKTD